MFLDTTYTPTWINLYLMNIDQTGDYLMSKKNKNKNKKLTERYLVWVLLQHYTFLLSFLTLEKLIVD